MGYVALVLYPFKKNRDEKSRFKNSPVIVTLIRQQQCWLQSNVNHQVETANLQNEVIQATNR
jgi:hypothetical protein